jgi:hypothetical protein
MADSILQMLGIRPADVNLLRDRGVPLDQPMPYDPSYQVPGSPPAQRVGDVAGGALSALPSVGDAYSVLQAIADLEAGNYGEAALNGVNALPMVAGLGSTKFLYRGLAPDTPENRAIGSLFNKGQAPGEEIWSPDRLVAKGYAQGTGNMKIAGMDPEAKVLALINQDGSVNQQGKAFYEKHTGQTLSDDDFYYRVLESGFSDISDAVRKENYDAVLGMDLDGPETVVLNKGVLREMPRNRKRGGSGPASSVLSDIGHQPTEFELSHQTAQKNAALPVEKGGLGLPADNTAMDRAKAMGFDTPAYHGTNADFSEFDALQGKSRTDAPSFANFFTSSPKNASSYAGRRKGGNVMPVLLKTDNPVDFEAIGPWSQMESPISGSAYDFRYGQYRDIRPGSLIDINTLSSLAKKAGNDSVVVRNLADYGGRSGELADTSILFDPRNIRSRFAAFDPMRRDSANILAGSLLGSLGLQFLEGGGYEDRLP